MDSLPQRLAAATDRDTLARALHDHLRDDLGATTATVGLAQRDGRIEVFGPAPPTNDRTVAITDRAGQVVGWLAGDHPGDAGAFRAALESTAGPAGIAFEVIRLAERLAERMDAERRAEREMAIAREVQRRLLPQVVPQLRHLELAAQCLQARAVGGDHYDFLDLGGGQLGLVLADISGKGMPAALRMAHLQAHIRSQVSNAPKDPPRVLREVNRMLRESSEPGQFATLFFGMYTDGSGRLAYINCGHHPPLVLRADGSAEWLGATATVLGAFEHWECTIGRTRFTPGDALIVYSDGVTEAGSPSGEFGEERLLAAVRARRAASTADLVGTLIEQVLAHSAGQPSDDLTLLVARVREGAEGP